MSPDDTSPAIASLAGLPPIEPDNDATHDIGADEAASESDAQSSSSTSISSSVRDFAFENSRRYHKFKEGRYVFPNDEPEQEREDMKHVVAVHLLEGKLHLSPLERPRSILDIGTGTGIWAIDMSDEYPEAEVVGLDLSPIQPAWVPPNVKFLVDDAEAPWLNPPNSLDFVHLRNMSTAIKDWPALLSRAYEALKPGGWIEIQDFRWSFACDDGTMPDTHPPAQMVKLVRDALAKFNVDLYISTTLPERVPEAGFANMVHTVRRVPVGPWPRETALKTIGLYTRGVIYDGLQAITLGPFTRGLGWSPEEVEQFLVKVRQGLLNPLVHSYVYFHCLCAQKPLDDTPES